MNNKETKSSDQLRIGANAVNNQIILWANEFEAAEIKKFLGGQTPVEAACQDIASHLQADGFELTIPPETKDGKGCITCSIGNKFDSEQILQKQAVELF